MAKNLSDYLLFIDADDTLVFANEAAFPPLTQDLYYVNWNTSDYGKHILLVGNHLNWTGKALFTNESDALNAAAERF